MSVKEDIDDLKHDILEVNDVANEVAKRANNELSVAKRKITCLTIIISLLFVLGACIALYSIHSFKELFYDMSIDKTTTEQIIDGGDNGNTTGIIGDNNEVHN